MPLNKLGDSFRRFAIVVTEGIGSPLSFIFHLIGLPLYIVIMGPFQGWDPTLLQVTTFLTVTTQIIAVLMLNAQNRDAKAQNQKLNALIEASRASNRYIDLEDCDETELKEIVQIFKEQREKEQNVAKKEKDGTNS